MTDRLFDIVGSLIDIIGDETARLRAGGPFADCAEIAAAKARLVSQLELRIVELRRDGDAGLSALDDDRRTLAELFARLASAARMNGEALQRQLELATEMMAAVAAEAQRLSGTRSSAYSALGEIWTRDGQTPISLNARL